MAVSRVDIHHEGGGTPSTDVERFASGGYVVGIGEGRWSIFRRAVDNWATKHFNHVDVAICFSGNRMLFPITDDDLRCVREAMAELRHRGEVVDNPDVHPHGTLYNAPSGNLPGSSPTQCPGILTLQRWPAIVAACQASAPVPSPAPGPAPGPVPSPVEDDMKILVEANGAPDGNPFCGVEIDITNQTVTPLGGAGFVPAPGPYIANGGHWLNACRTEDATDGVTQVLIVNDKLEKYRFRVKPRP